ncbi:EamA family transporter RarD [Shewanella submarina]|uniref:EamA family transporter RarD n=1 Tax=Shewanella submarina TaxID=2016376 RepID=A0ABV7GAM3_9GAMM|nr:EamA family transporter RarD [Shewanella submarina]MCL1038570.1 EamA family transporter RarD [Shewanella submarina]
MKTQTKGNLLAAFSFLLWGILPLYYQYLPGADIYELLAYRLLFSVPVMLIILALLGRKLNWQAVLADKRSMIMALLASCIMCVSWCAFTIALTHGQVLAASLGFFINPLFAIALGVLFLKDKLTHGQAIAVLLGLSGIVYQVVSYGELPVLALLMGSFFALYGLAKKFIRFDALTSVTIEAMWLAPLALVYLIYLFATGQSQSGSSWQNIALYIGAAPVTLAPLVFFAMAIMRTTLTNIGLMQYIEPSVQFLLAVLLFGEAFDEVKLVSFSLIWAGLLICTLEALPWYKRRKAMH